jgi:hypothetical protein
MSKGRYQVIADDASVSFKGARSDTVACVVFQPSLEKLAQGDAAGLYVDPRIPLV